MYQLSDYIQIISPLIYGGALIVSILQFSATRKSMFSQSVQQTYATTTQLPFNLGGVLIFTRDIDKVIKEDWHWKMPL